MVLFTPYIGPYQVLPLKDWVGREANGNEGVLRTPQTLALVEPHYQIFECHSLDPRWGCLTTLGYQLNNYKNYLNHENLFKE